MTPQQHYQEAERLLAEAQKHDWNALHPNYAAAQANYAAAQVHAILATVQVAP